MLKNCKVGAIVFLVSELERTLAFYRDTLGLPLNQLSGHDGPYALAQVGDVVLVFIVQKTAKPGDTRWWCSGSTAASTTTPTSSRARASRSSCR